MMGRTHAVSGILSGELTLLMAKYVPVVSPVPFEVAVLFVLVITGATLLPDLDQPSSVAARSLGPVTRWMARGIGAGSVSLYHLTRGPGDNPGREGGHRLVTHTPIGCVAFGAVALVAQASPVTACVSLGLLVALGFRAVTGGRGDTADAIRRVTRTLGVTTFVALVAGTGLAWYVVTRHPDASLVWGFAVVIGCWAHREGDRWTIGGVPRATCPVRVGTRSWGRTRPLGDIRTGGAEEAGAVLPVLFIAIIVVTLSLVGVLGDIVTLVMGTL